MTTSDNEEPFDNEEPVDDEDPSGGESRPVPRPTVDDLASLLDRCWTMVEHGSADAGELRRELCQAVDIALAENLDDAAVLVDYAVAIADTVADDVRIGDPTLGGAVRAHLDRRLAIDAGRAALDEQLAVLEAGLSFGCAEQIDELTDLCRAGRRQNTVLLASGDAAAHVVNMAARHGCVSALHAAVRPHVDAEWRLGWHPSAWLRAFDALAEIAWHEEHQHAQDAREVLVDLLHPPSTCLDASVRIRPSWLAGDTSSMVSALLALDRHEAGLAGLPPGVQPHELVTTIHALRSLLWLAQDSKTTMRNHSFWTRA